MDTRDSLERLTEREKEPLRLWLQHKTAKEIAVELGISHHAVEKRLKMARTKLGTSSSLEAARLLHDAEGYGRTVSYSPEVASRFLLRQAITTRSLVIGAITMSTITAAVLAFLMQGAGANPDYEPASRMAEAGPTEISSMARTTFDSLDADNSGFLEGIESPMVEIDGASRLDEAGDHLPMRRVPRSVEQMRDEFYRQADWNGDDRISYAEYYQWVAPDLAQTGTQIR